jgi:anti-sigma-K factor RskA
MADHPTPHPDLGGYVLGVLEPTEAEAFEAHLGGCDDCRGEVGSLSGLPGLLESAPPPAEVPAGLRRRTFAAVEEAATRSGPTGAARRKVWRRLLAAVAAVAVLGTAAAAVRQATRPGPAGVEVALVAPDGGPAHGVARIRVVEGGRRIDMEVDGLARPPSGGYYECWYVGAGDTPDHPNRVSSGSFTVDARGAAKVAMVTAADRQRFPRIDVTLEPGDGNPARQGPTVLVGRRS